VAKSLFIIKEGEVEISKELEDNQAENNYNKLKNKYEPLAPLLYVPRRKK